MLPFYTWLCCEASSVPIAPLVDNEQPRQRTRVQLGDTEHHQHGRLDAGKVIECHVLMTLLICLKSSRMQLPDEEAFQVQLQLAQADKKVVCFDHFLCRCRSCIGQGMA